MTMSDSTPIILLGAARSGTKFLRDVIGEDPAVACVPYDISYVWRYGNEAHPDDALTREDVHAKVRKFVPTQLARIAGKRRGDTRQLLEKTVGNTLRVEFVDEIYPNAKFVHLVRDGRAVTESAMRLWQAPQDWAALFKKLRGMPFSNIGYAAWFAKNAIVGRASGRNGGKVWGPRYPGIEEDVAAQKTLEEICARQWVESVRHAREGLASLPSHRHHTVRYEDLLGYPGALAALVSFLDLPNGDLIRDTFSRKATLENRDKWRDLFSTEQVSTITSIARPELEAFGYPI